ncbi:putative RNA polymerase II subunit B1 CTD phosphatase RPAP2 [Spea bombifrons]|uniref:putative RNA polymerase II subunit B1 CTD phosphatase RPAP2 n=1 Tax=Spea bombifrons TaxID=233779 RepID=UPI00234AC423|nr:putative RNA polymerase II subunit B1 CTD phosphatase RPAP2 [Spea bombifrons]
MAERKSSSKSRKSARGGSEKSKISDLNSEDAAKRRAALENAIRRKIEAEKRALRIVERLLEDDVTEDFLLGCGRFISPSQYKDSVEERFIVKLCGYPICKKKLENVPKQKYKISTRTNKVYDITDRKRFCSDFCYRASKYYEAQLPQSPIWMREEESPPEIKLLKEGKSGRSGVEVKLTVKPIKPSDVEKFTAASEDDSVNSDSDGDAVKEPKPAFVSSIISVDEEGIEDGETLEAETYGSEEGQKLRSNDSDAILKETTERLNLCKLDDRDRNGPVNNQNASLGLPREDVSIENTEIPESRKRGDIEIAGVTQRAVSKRGAEQLRKILCNSKKYQSALKDTIHPVVVKKSMLEVLTQTVNEWKTEETLKYLFGSNYKVETDFKTDASNVNDHLEELDEDDLESTLETSRIDGPNSIDESLPFQDLSKAEKPAPDYAKLTEEKEAFQIKVQEFFGGRYVLPEEVEQEDKERTKVAENTEKNSWVPALPLVDSCSQQQMRKRIVIEKLKKVLPAILLPLRITYSDISKELHNLVKTFRFSNTNITHTTPEWSIIAVVLLSVLLPTIPLHKDCEQNPLYTQFVSKLLEELHFQKEDLEFLKQKLAGNTLSFNVA